MARPSYPKIGRTVDVKRLNGKRQPGQITIVTPLTVRISPNGPTVLGILSGVGRVVATT